MAILFARKFRALLLVSTLCLAQVAFVLAALPAAGGTDKDQYLELARKGWIYDLRSAMWKRDAASPPIRINGRELAGVELCVFGEAPHPHTLRILNAFRALMREVHDKPMPLRIAGTDLSGCRVGDTVYLRLYSGQAPHRALNDDLRRMDASYGIGFSQGRYQLVASPAQAQTFFGKNGQATHLLVKQGRSDVLTALEQRFFASILIEELYQSFTFGMDILHLDRAVVFRSKLEEYPVNLRNVSWDSPDFMKGLLRSNPAGLCPFDVFMMHAVASAPVDRTNSAEFLRFIQNAFDELIRRTDKTVARAEYAPIVDASCKTD